jgi:hypothetical protein
MFFFWLQCLWKLLGVQLGFTSEGWVSWLVLLLLLLLLLLGLRT